MDQDRARGIFRNVQLRDLRHHASDHRAIVATIWAGGRDNLKKYRRKVGGNPLLKQLPKEGPLPRGEDIIERLRKTIPRTPKRELPCNAWISEETWRLVDRRASQKLNGRGKGNEYALGRKIGASFRKDSLRHRSRVMIRWRSRRRRERLCMLHGSRRAGTFPST